MSALNRKKLPFDLCALAYAADYVGIEEVGGSNRGPAVELFLRAANLGAGKAWCAAFFNDMGEMAQKLKNVRSPLERVPLQGYVQSYYDHWEAEGLLVEPEDVGPGFAFMLWYPWLDDGAGRWGHIGFVDRIATRAGVFWTIEGNTDDQASREGIKVATRDRKILRYPELMGVAFADWARRVG